MPGTAETDVPMETKKSMLMNWTRMCRTSQQVYGPYCMLLPPQIQIIRLDGSAESHYLTIPNLNLLLD